MSGRLKDYDPNEKQSGRKTLTILLSVLAALVALLLLILFGRSCGSDTDTGNKPALPADIPATPPNPDISGEDIEPAPDSLSYQVNRRIILLIQNEDKSPADFVAAFRKFYPDTDKYVLSAPDAVLPRFVLSLPRDEKSAVEAALPDQFPEFDLMILPETLFTTNKRPMDPGFSDARKRWYFDMCGIEDAWDDTMGSSDVVVAVIDGCFDLSHPELAGQVIDYYNAVNHDSHVFCLDGDGHGTHVAATVVGKADNASGVCGIAPDCRLMVIQVADANGNMTMSSLIDAVLYAIIKGADVVNISMGMDVPSWIQNLSIGSQKDIILNCFKDEETMWRKIFGMGIKKEMAFVMAGGNDDMLIGLDPMQRIDGTIRVSAVQPDRAKTVFSNYGPYSVLSAPGVAIYNAVPENDYEFYDGTSMASPIVAGCIALMKSKNPNLTTADIIRILQDTGIPSPSDVANIVHFKKALDAVPGDGTRPVPPGEENCDAIRDRYQALLDELERIQREHPECIVPRDTLVLPPNMDLTDLTGLWKSTTPIHNDDGEALTLYYAFNGTPQGVFTIVEPSGAQFTASLDVSIVDDTVHIVQTENATSKDADGEYHPYTTDCQPDPKTRVADCVAVNQMLSRNRVRFNLVKIK